MLNRYFAVGGLAIYLAIMVLIGFIYINRQKSSGDYLLGGFSMGPNLIAVSNLSLMVSAATFMGYGGMGYSMGLTGLWAVWPVWLGTWLWGRYGSPRMRAKGQFTTLPEFLEHEYGQGSKGHFSRKFCSIIVIIRDAGWVATGMVGFGLMGDLLLGTPYWLSALVGMAITVLYVYLGGYLAATITNFFQTILIFVGSLFVAAAAIAKCGGLGNTISALLTEHPTAFSALNVPVKQILAWIVLYQFFHWCVQSVVIKTSLSAANSKIAMKGSGQSGVIQCVWYAVPFFLGMIAKAALGPNIVASTSYVELVVWVGGPIVGALLLIPFAAAVMSTADTALLSAASNITNDWYATSHPDATEEQKIKIAKYSVIGLSVLAYFIAIVLPLVLELAVMGLKFATILAPAIFGAIFWKKSRGAIKSYTCSIVIGSVVLAIVQVIQTRSATMVGTMFIYGIDPLFIALPLTAIIFIVGVFLEKRSVNQAPTAIPE